MRLIDLNRDDTRTFALRLRPLLAHLWPMGDLDAVVIHVRINGQRKTMSALALAEALLVGAQVEFDA
jgi:hypothetical protein